MNTDEYPNLLTCPRCGGRSFEYLKEHDCCHNCNYSTEFSHYREHDAVPKWALKSVSDFESENSVEQRVLPNNRPKKNQGEAA